MPFFLAGIPAAASLGSSIAASTAIPAAAAGAAAASKAAAAAALLGKIGAGVSTAAGIGSQIAGMVNKPKMPDSFNPVQAGPAEIAPIGGGMNLNPLQKNDPNNQRYGAVTDLLQRGY